MLLIVVLALGAALLYGVADFMGGVAARRITVLLATTINYTFAAAVIVAAAFGGEWSAAAVGGGVIAGALAVVGLLTFFAALAAGPISLMSPLIALLSSVVPVVATVIVGEACDPSPGSRSPSPSSRRCSSESNDVPVLHVRPRTVVFAVISGASLGFATVALDGAPAFVLIFQCSSTRRSASRSCSAFAGPGRARAGVVGSSRCSTRTALRPSRRRSAHSRAAAAPTHRWRRTPVPREGRPTAAATRRARQLAALAGVLIGGANALLMIALHAGNVAVVAVLVNFYPAATVALAWGCCTSASAAAGHRSGARHRGLRHARARLARGTVAQPAPSTARPRADADRRPSRV